MAILKRDGYRCQPCKQEGRLSEAVEVDHITPLAEGGHATDPANLQGICLDCHAAKSQQESARGLARVFGSPFPMKHAMQPEAHTEPREAIEGACTGVGEAGMAGGAIQPSGAVERKPPLGRNCEKISAPAVQSTKVDGRKGNGGARPGSGPKPAPSNFRDDEQFQTDDPEAFLRAVMADPASPMKDRMTAALALKKTGKAGAPQGKKERQQEEAQDVARGKLTPLPAPRPRLRAV